MKRVWTAVLILLFLLTGCGEKTITADMAQCGLLFGHPSKVHHIDFYAHLQEV